MSKRRRNAKDDIVIALIVAIVIAGAISYIIKHLGIVILCIFAICTIGSIAWIIIKRQTKSSNESVSTTEPTIAEAEEQKADKIIDLVGKYEAHSLLTDHEMNFYRALKPIADNLGLSIISKVRMADLVKPTANYYQERSEYMSYFGRIKSKHVDFVLCDPDTLKVRLLIELDDKSHETNQMMDRDEFVENVYRDTGYKLLRAYTNWDLEKKIRDALGITEEYKIKTP